jgi:hypothetical protein
VWPFKRRAPKVKMRPAKPAPPPAPPPPAYAPSRQSATYAPPRDDDSTLGLGVIAAIALSEQSACDAGPSDAGSSDSSSGFGGSDFETGGNVGGDGFSTGGDF